MYNELKNKKEKINKILIMIATIIVAVLFVIFKCFSLGWSTIFAIVLGIHPALIVLYIIIGIRIAEIKKRSFKDYFRWFLMSICFLFHSIVFVDSGDTEQTYKLLQNVPNNTLNLLTIITLVLNIVLIVIYFVIYKNKIYRNMKKELQTDDFDDKKDRKVTFSIILGIIDLVLLLISFSTLSFANMFFVSIPFFGLIIGVISEEKSPKKYIGIILNSLGLFIVLGYMLFSSLGLGINNFTSEYLKSVYKNEKFTILSKEKIGIVEDCDYYNNSNIYKYNIKSNDTNVEFYVVDTYKMSGGWCTKSQDDDYKVKAMEKYIEDFDDKRISIDSEKNGSDDTVNIKIERKDFSSDDELRKVLHDFKKFYEGKKPFSKDTILFYVYGNLYENGIYLGHSELSSYNINFDADIK